MRAWTRSRGFAAGFLLIVATNAIVLGGVAYNRSSEPESLLELTQRELHPLERRGRSGETEWMSLLLQWRVLPEESPRRHLYSLKHGAGAWLDAAKLAEIGFDVSVPAHTPHAVRHYRRQLPRAVLLVLEMDGPAYREALARAERRAALEQARAAADPQQRTGDARWAADQLERERSSASRLFAIDAGLDADALRRKYPDRTRYAIIRGKARIYVDPYGDAAGALRGFVSDIGNTEINLPREFAAAIEDHPMWRAEHGEATPPVDMRVAFGRRLEPWLESVSPAAAPAPSEK